MKFWILQPLLLLLCSCAMFEGEKPQSDMRASYRAETPRLDSEYRGWDFVVEKLREKGISEEELEYIYTSSKMPRFEHIRFSISPKESSDAYSGHLAAGKIERARNFIQRNRDTLNKAKLSHGVSENVIAAILLVESDYGTNTGSDKAIHRLSRLVATADPENQEWNYERLRRENPRVTMEQVEGRAEYLENLFLPEIVALLEIARENKIDIFEIKGSRAGALGMPQFLPTTYQKYAVDGDQDGRISLFREPDAIWSVANYLKSQGWKGDRPLEKNRQALWEYNRSDAYVDTIIKVASSLAKEPRKAPTTRKAASKQKPVSDFSMPAAEELPEQPAADQASLSERMRDAITDWSQQNSF